ncbi:hypothetical protein [Aneurinibacillus aneurinilyticus]|uniref:hypothetical protein n=1 Tax=Aneurinibacillus aneurinilyticus TaxID=1391 RepID=UPI0023F446FC|nr:hypothetical protein [Aneurinibacillus aneurinilyticus]
MKQVILSEIYSAIAEYSAAYEKVETLDEPVKSAWVKTLQKRREYILNIIDEWERVR